MTVSVAKNGTWMTQFRCKDRTGNEIHKCKRGFASAEEAHVSVNIFFTIFTNVFSPIAPTRMRRIRQR